MPAMMSDGRSETELLLEQSYFYDFVQAVRILQRSRPDRPLVGYDALPGQEIVRFCCCPELRHASSDIRSIQRVGDGTFEVTLAFDALIGASGILPHHYTRLIRLRAKEGDAAFREFLDIFVHRFVSNYFRACTKYRTSVGFDLFSSGREEFRELSTRCLANTAGFSHDRLGRVKANQHLFLYFSGHFSDHRPTRSALEGMLAHLTGTNLSLREFQFELLYLDEVDQT